MRAVVLPLVLGCALAAGCAGVGQAPRGLSLAEAVIVPVAGEPTIEINGPSGKFTGGAAGAAKGGTAGFFAGGLMCVGTGFLFPLCVAAVVPATTAIGAVGWGTVAAVRADTAEGVAHKHGLLAAELASRPYPALLTQQFQREAHERMSVDVGIVPPGLGALTGGAVLWTIELALTEVTTERSAPGERFRLRAAGRLALRRIGQGEVVFARNREATSVSFLTTEQWAADDGVAVRDGLGQALQRLAAELMDDLLGQRHADAIDLRVPAVANPASLAASEAS